VSPTFPELTPASFDFFALSICPIASISFSTIIEIPQASLIELWMFFGLTQLFNSRCSGDLLDVHYSASAFFKKFSVSQRRCPSMGYCGENCRQ
jgi:hypothetical protein